MTAICPAHVEWATVDRMRQMLAAPPIEFEVTGTLALFTGILCWTMQRIRTEQDETDAIALRMKKLARDLQNQPFSAFLKTDPNIKPQLVQKTNLDGTHYGDAFPFNSLDEFEEDGKPLKAFQSLVRLRDAVGHGDARRLIPISQEGVLVGYQFEGRRYEDGFREQDVKWRGKLCLNAAGMASIAGEVADQFCAALQGGDPNLATDASSVLEARSQ